MQWGLSPALGCANDACSTRLARKTYAVPLLLLLSLPCLSKIPKVPEYLPCMPLNVTGWRESSPAVYKFHRPLTWFIGTKIVPVGTIYCRPAESPCSRQIDSSSKTAVHGMDFGAYVSMVMTSYHAWGLKEV